MLVTEGHNHYRWKSTAKKSGGEQYTVVTKSTYNKLIRHRKYCKKIKNNSSSIRHYELTIFRNIYKTYHVMLIRITSDDIVQRWEEESNDNPQ